MRLALRLSRPAPNQNLKNPRLWQDPVFGYWETHGKMEFLPGEQYNLSDDEKKAVLWRYRVKEQGIILDPAMFRWYAADMTQTEYFRLTPRTVFIYAGLAYLFFWVIVKLGTIGIEKDDDECTTGELLWWDRVRNRMEFVGGSAPPRQVQHAHC
uniref:NADH dehydrogenase [ubiquinone] 1 beta subcomplex subunit 4 n=1 Tax=Meloidogyne hapla TaxID=6305 RepID=A0A1I8BQA6_MELHA